MTLRLAALLLLLLPAAAQGATVTVKERSVQTLTSRDTVVYRAAPGEVNQLTVTFAGDGKTVTVADPGAPVTATDGCETVDEHAARCATEELIAADVELGDGDDTLASVTPEGPVVGELRANGGPGADTLAGGASRDVFVDADAAEGDTYDGGDAFDIVTYARRSDGVVAGGENGEDAYTEIEQLTGSSGNDTLTGTGERDILDGGPGDDQLLGLGRADTLLGGPGRDRLRGADGDDDLRGGEDADDLGGGAGDDRFEAGAGADRFGCGAGRDTVDGAPLGPLGADCERLRLSNALSVQPTPVRVGRRAIVLRLFARATSALGVREVGDRRRRLGRAAGGGPGLVRVRLTRYGRRAVRRPSGVLARVTTGTASWVVQVRR